MKAKLTMLSLLLVLTSAGLAAADSYDDCTAECGTAQKQCIDAITLYDEAGIKEAKDACFAQTKLCGKKCHDLDDMGADAYQEMQKKQAEEAERKRQEQEIKDNGNIKLYNGDQGSGAASGQDQGQSSDSDGIKTYQQPEQPGGGIKTYQFNH